MKLSNNSIVNESETLSTFMQDLSMEMQETITGGYDQNGGCANCAVDDLWLEDDSADDSSGDGVINIRFKAK
ncbi:MAG: hypothetical protein AAGF98_00940 [Cyanobacteria bacterium P01_H01_bin.153]